MNEWINNFMTLYLLISEKEKSSELRDVNSEFWGKKKSELWDVNLEIRGKRSELTETDFFSFTSCNSDFSFLRILSLHLSILNFSLFIAILTPFLTIQSLHLTILTFFTQNSEFTSRNFDSFSHNSEFTSRSSDFFSSEFAILTFSLFLAILTFPLRFLSVHLAILTCFLKILSLHLAILAFFSEFWDFILLITILFFHNRIKILKVNCNVLSHNFNFSSQNLYFTTVS